MDERVTFAGAEATTKVDNPQPGEYELKQALGYLNSAAEILLGQGDHAAALACLESCCAVAPKNANCANNLAFVLEKIGRHEEALEICQAGIGLNPKHPQLHHNHGLILTSLGNESAAIAAYRHAISLNPQDAEAHLNLGLLLARQGHWAEALREYEWRFQAHENLGKFRNRFKAPPWKGEPLDGKRIAVYCEQGMGDAIWFSRFVPCLKARWEGATIIAEVPFELVRLFEGEYGFDRVEIRSGLEEPAALPEYDYAASMLSLPYLLNTEKPDWVLPRLAMKRYKPGRELNEKPRLPLPESRPKIGLCWAGSPGHPNDAERSIPLKMLEPLIDAGDFSWYTFQKAPLKRTWPQGEVDLGSTFEFPVPLTRLEGQLCDFYAAACLLQEMDLLITVDTAMAHLAGTIGKAVYVLLPYQHDWRWPVHGETTNWYPTMRLFRQSSARDWAEVVEKVKIALMRAWKPDHDDRKEASGPGV